MTLGRQASGYERLACRHASYCLQLRSIIIYIALVAYLHLGLSMSLVDVECRAVGSPGEYDVASILDEEARLRANRAHLRARDMAEAIGVPEAALVEAHRLQHAAFALRRPPGPTGFGAILTDLISAGDVIALTRNGACVSEMYGAYTEPSFYGSMGQVVGEIDLRLFLDHWVHGYAVAEDTRSGAKLSLQFFDGAGSAVHKVYVTNDTDLERFEDVIARYADGTVEPARLVPPGEEPAERPDDTIDVEGLLAGWRTLQHSHDFFGLLRRFGVTRRQAMRLGAREFTHRAAASLTNDVLNAAADHAVPLMIFVGNRGCIQIVSGAIGRVVQVDAWLNVLDPRFNLHLRTDLIDTAWLVRKPTARGDIHSLELFDATGFCFAQIFGERKPGTAERGDWRALVRELSLA